MTHKQSYPLYFEAKEDLKEVKCELTPEQQEQRERDSEVIAAMDAYYEPYRERWRINGALYNLVQSPPDDLVSNWYLGASRVLINHSVAMTSNGMAEADFKMPGPSDFKLQVLWNSMVKNSLNKCNWMAQQRLWNIDNHVFGGGVIKNFAEIPMRKHRYERPNGKFADRLVRDFRRSKVGLRQRSVFRCMRSPWIIDPDDVLKGVEIEELTYDMLVTKYKNAKNDDGTDKYDFSGVPVGSHARLYHLYDELDVAHRIYCVTWGGKAEAKETYASCPSAAEIGYPILDKPLAHYKRTKDGKSMTGGVNLQGYAPLSFSVFADQLDEGYETHSICGMGIPQIIEGPESLTQALANMMLDDVRNALSVPISYTPNSKESPSALDLDVRTMLGGLVVDGTITPQPLSSGNIGSGQVLEQWFRQVAHQLTGINPEQLSGDNLKTAFQSGLIIRQMNMHAEARVNAWANGPLKRAMTILLADCLCHYTQEEWEEVTEAEAKDIADLIGSDQMTGEDYTTEDYEDPDTKEKTVIHKKRVHQYIPVEGYKFREDFTGDKKKRSMNANSTDNTLIEDKKMPGNVSSVPADINYLAPGGRLERTLQYETHIDGKPMLLDLKAQDMEMGDKMMRLGMELKPLVPEIDLKKQYAATGRIAGFEEKDLFATEVQGDETQEEFANVAQELEDMVSSPPLPNAPLPPNAPGQAAPGAPSPQAPAAQPAGPAALAPGVGGPQKLLDRVSSGNV